MHGHRWASLALVAAVAVLAAACASASPGTASLRGQRIEVLAVWSGAEAARFGRVITGFEAATGASVSYTSEPSGVPAALAARVASGSVPDVAFLPQPGTLRQYAAQGRLMPLDAATAGLVGSNYGSVWRGLGSYQGRLYGVWFKAADKSLVWYRVAAFEQAGVVPPATLDRLMTVARRFSASGLAAFAVGGSDRWTLTDWFENLYLDVAGPSGYDLLATHRRPWTDPSVRTTLGLMESVLAPELVAGGTAGMLSTTFRQSVDQVFGARPAAAMTSEGDFVAGVVSSDTGAVLGVDADAFPFPPFAGSPSGVVGGGDVAVMLRRSPAADAFLRYLATPEAAARWASEGGFISPNLNLDPSVYPDPITRFEARGLLDAGDSFRFDLSDLQPPAFGSTPTAGMEGELAAFLVDRDVEGTAVRLEAAARAAYGS
ncbi:MAG TPA: ABC transporter substrate-binding protein [Acidimicrobiales bacterium]|nr:ABC transporter substrate-binding protein [Acidimicrobiales bacterium]